jgi:hypothetical protein
LNSSAPPPEDQIIDIIRRLSREWGIWEELERGHRQEINAPLPLLPEEIDPRKEKLLEIQTSLLPQ